MSIDRPVWWMALLVMLLASGCAGSTDSGIIQERRGTGMKETEQQTEALESATEIEDPSLESRLYIITQIDTENKVIAVQKAADGRQFQYAYDTGTKFLDKYGDTKSVTSFQTGDVAELEILDSKQQLLAVQLSADVWVQEDIVHYSVEESIHAITIGDVRYSYAADMDVFSGEHRVELASLGKFDILRAVGVDKKILSLAITRGHGYLKLANTKLFEGSFVCVGDKIFQEVTSNMQIEVPEGKHLVTVANDGYGGSREVTINREEITSLNLDELKGEGPKVCKITFVVGVEGAVLRIDGKQADYSKPVEVRYGVHTISVEAEGYDTISEKLVVNSKKAEIEIALTSATGKSDSQKETEPSEQSGNQINSGTTAGNGGNTANHPNNTTDTNNSNNSNNSGNNNNSNQGGSTNTTNTDSSGTDYLTTLYNLLTSINNNNNSNGAGTAGTGADYDNLMDQ